MSGLDDQAAPGGARQDAAPGGELLQSTPSVTDALDALELEKPLSKSRLKDVCDRFGIDQSRAQDKKDPGRLLQSIWFIVATTFFAFFVTVLADVAGQQGWHKTCVALHITASILLFAGIPLTHLAGALGYAGWTAFMPFIGGSLFVSYQAVGWLLYAMSMVMSVSTLVSFAKGLVESAVGLATLWGALALISQILITSSIFTFEDPKASQEPITSKNSPEKICTPSPTTEAFESATLRIERAMSFSLPAAHCEPDGTEDIFSALDENMPLFIAMNVILVTCGVVLAFISASSYGDHPYFTLYVGFSATMFFTVGLFNTYGVGGHTLYGRLKSGSNWTFFQPGKGGVRFVALQMLSWLVFSASLILQLGVIFVTYAFGFQMFLSVMGVAGVLCLVAEILMVLSLTVYRGYSVEVDASYILKLLREGIDNLHGLLIVTVLCNIMYFPFVILWVPFFVLVPAEEVLPCWTGSTLSISLFVLSFATAVNTRLQNSKQGRGDGEWHWMHFMFINVAMDLPILVVVHGFLTSVQAKLLMHVVMVCQHVYIAYTYGGNPAETGVRRAPKETLDDLTFLFDHLRKYFSARIIRTAPLDKDAVYMFGYHPHGIVPLTLLWFTLTSAWKELFPGLTVNPCSASVLHSIPLLRDVFHFFGVREVTIRAIKSCFDQGQSVALVPGGQKEMVYTSTAEKKIRLYTKHTGFMRVALASGAALVPIFTFGETHTLSNVRMEKTQLWFIQRFGIPVPHYPFGRWLLPIPRPVKLTIVVGEPIVSPVNDNPSEAELRELYHKYYDAVRRMFEKHKHEAGYGDWELVLMR